MRLKVEFKYQCEVEIKEDEVKTLEDKLKYSDLVSDLSKEINWMLLAEDGRTEAGGVVDFDYKLED